MYSLLISFFLLVTIVEAGRYGDILLSGSHVLHSTPKSIPQELHDIDNIFWKVLEQQSHGKFSGIENVSKQCLNHLNITVQHLIGGDAWALQFLDSAGKLGAGILEGNIAWLGSFDECVNTTATVYLGPNNTKPSQPFKGQYCKIGIPLSAAAPAAADIGNAGIPPNDLQLGLCVPDTCNNQDILNTINTALGYLANTTGGKVNFTAEVVVCQKTHHDFDARAIASITILSILGVLVVIGTVYDVLVIHKLHVNPENEEYDNEEKAPLVPEPQSEHSRDIRHRGGYNSIDNGDGVEHGVLDKKQIQDEDKEIGLCGKILQAFSLYTNGSKLLSTKTQAGSLGAVNGIRFISMSWVILGHTYAFSMFSGQNTLPFITEHIQRFSFLAILNATVSVDSFFLLSGLLVSYLSLKELKKVGGPGNFRWGMFYFHRFWRLTPTYGLIMLLYIPLVKYLNNGPYWPDNGIEKDYCQDNWWMNLLYINNLFKSKDTCMAWGWYMANDMQFYILSPLLLVPLFIHGMLGGLVCLAFLAITFTTTGLLTSFKHLPSNILGIGGDPMKVGDYFDMIYVKPYCRIGPYIIGIIYGYILYRTNCQRRLNTGYNLFGWLVAAVCCLSSLYGNYQSVEGKHVMSTGESALYAAVVPTVWSIGVGWVIYSCAVGSGGIVNGFLSWKLFIPLSRLTYISYLIHPVIMEVFYGSLRNPFYFTDLIMVYNYLGHLVLANAAAFVLTLLFESPFLGLEKALFRRTKRH
ncbi:hypothetical protein ACF0H5_016256 [Mactra antiquata]